MGGEKVSRCAKGERYFCDEAEKSFEFFQFFSGFLWERVPMLTGDLMAQLGVHMIRSAHSRHNKLARMGL